MHRGEAAESGGAVIPHGAIGAPARLESGTRAPRLAGSARSALWILLACALAGCASFDQDVHLAPFYTNISTAGGGRELEAIAGVVRVRRPVPKAPVNEWAFRPLMSEKYLENGDWKSWFLVPLGTEKQLGSEYTLQLLPVMRYVHDIDEQGQPEWRLLTLPGVIWQRDNSGRIVNAIFPFGGVIENFLTFDRIVFALFPLYLRTERSGQISISFIWPIFNYTHGPLGKSFRIWPLFGHLHQAGNYDRWFFLWPFFHIQHNYLGSPTPESRWMFWPFYGRTRRGSYRAWSFIWPVFGYAHDSRTGFWSWDGPWPLVRILRPGVGEGPDAPYRTRLWPFYSYYRGDGLESTWVLWPIINSRIDTDAFGVRHSKYLIPLWQNWERVGPAGERTSWTKLWPLYQTYVEPDNSRFAFPALNPLWRTPVMDDHYAFIYELITRETRTEDGHVRVSDRSWGGIWRRESDENEDRASLAGVWASRSYEREGEDVVEHSLLFGLVRWRSYPKRPGVWPDLMRPAFPGPGWPAQRARRVHVDSEAAPAAGAGS